MLAENNELEFDFSGPHVRIRTKLRDIDGMTMKDLIIGPSTVTGQADLSTLGIAGFFDTPKPVSLLDLLVDVATGPEDLVMDYFAGSASTAHAVMARNARDGGNRRFVMVQLDEACTRGSTPAQAGYISIAAVGRERVRRAGQALGLVDGHPDWHKDVGFRSLKVDSTNMVDVLRTPDGTDQEELSLYTDSIKADRSAEDLLFQVLLDWGLEPTMPIESETVDGQQVFILEHDALIACFAEKVSDEVVSTIAERRPLRAVFRDAGFATDADRINAEQIFAERSPATDVKTI